MSQCPYCGASLGEKARFCKSCGQPLPIDQGAPPPARDYVANQLTQPLEQSAEPSPPPVPSRLPAASHDPDDTAPLEGAVTNFALLPEGALIPQTGSPARYYVLQVRNKGQKLNVYLVETLQPVLLCTNRDCPSPENREGEAYCAACGSALTVPPVSLRYLLKESSDPQTFAPQAKIRELGLNHPGLLLFEYFEEVPYGPVPRTYLLEPEPGPSLAASLAPPQEVPRVLDWGQQLAEALAYLHAHSLVWHKLDSYHVAIEGKRARWVNFNTYLIPEQFKAQQNDYYLKDVRSLAAFLFHLCTGVPTYTPDHQLPEPVGGLFEQVLGPASTITNASALSEALKTTLEEVRRPTNVRLVSGAQTDVGSVRDLNEDSLLAQELNLVHRGISLPMSLYVVADGMGGHSAGDVASGMVINTMAHKMASEVVADQIGPEGLSRSFDAAAWLNEAIAAANTAVFEQRRQARTDMGTTLVAALMMGDTAYIGHVGDSRAYLLNEEGIRQLTADHSLVERLVATGQITREEARSHPQRNVIYRTIGDKARVESDIASHRLAVGDHLLLCSDGLSGMVFDDDIWRIVMNNPSPPDACRRLIDAANLAGGDDNITVIIVRVEAA
jgi:serine/threonine protein phosphatase PrpC